MVEAAPECARCPVPGACCKFVLLPLGKLLSNDEIHWLQLHPGLRYVEVDEVPCVKISIPCSALNDQGRCELVGSRDRPKMCANWPGPQDLERWIRQPMPDEEHDRCVFIQEAREAAAVPVAWCDDDSGNEAIDDDLLEALAGDDTGDAGAEPVQWL